MKRVLLLLLFLTISCSSEQESTQNVNEYSLDDKEYMETETLPDEELESFSYDGDGTEANPYQIKTVEDLDSMRNNNENFYVLMNDIDLSELEFDTNERISGWESISEFNGTLDGQNNVIKNLQSKSFRSMAFIYLNRGTIKNLHLEDVTIICTDFLAAPLVCYNYGTIKNSSTSGVVAAYSSGAGFVGGNTGTISNCYSDVTVSATNAGGLLGYNYGPRFDSTLNQKRWSIVDSSSYTGVVTGNVSAGGFINANMGKIFNSSAEAIVTGTDKVGGFAATNYNSDDTIGIIDGCYAKSDVSGVNVVGGFVAYQSYALITNSYSLSKVSGDSAVGGFIGEMFPRMLPGDANQRGLDFINCVSFSTLSNGSEVGYYGDGFRDYPIGCFWLSDTLLEDNRTNGRAIGKTMEELLDMETYTDWDFIDKWKISSSINNGLPSLKWEN